MLYAYTITQLNLTLYIAHYVFTRREYFVSISMDIPPQWVIFGFIVTTTTKCVLGMVDTLIRQSFECMTEISIKHLTQKTCIYFLCNMILHTNRMKRKLFFSSQNRILTAVNHVIKLLVFELPLHCPFISVNIFLLRFLIS